MRHGWRHFALRLALVPLGLMLLWSAGLVWFIAATEATLPPPPRADGIIALTGGAGRVERALRLLADGQAERLLISGVGRTEFTELAARAGVEAGLAPRVTLGHMATNTFGNAREAADWAAAHAIASAIVVTSAYHMPRAMLELSRAMPAVSLHAAPVATPPERPRLRLLAGEYTKLLAAQIGLSRLDRTR